MTHVGTCRYWGSAKGAMRRTAFGSSLLCSTLAAFGAHAEGSGIEVVTVTAEKRSEDIHKVPISVSVLTGEKLDASTFAGVSEALNTVPSVDVFTDYLGGTNTVVRGVTAAFPHFTGSSPVAYYLDTIPFGFVVNATGPDANAFDLSRVEVLRGPQGTLYGAGSLNGVVRVLTQDPDLDNFDVKLRFTDSGTYHGGNNYGADAAVNVPIIDGVLAARAVVGYQDNSGWINSPVKDGVNHDATKTYRFKILAQPTDRLNIGASIWSSRDYWGSPAYGFTYGEQSSLMDQRGFANYDAAGLSVNYQFDDFSISSATSYLRYRNDSNLALDAVDFFGGLPDTDYFTSLKSNVFSEEVNLHSTDDSDWRWSVGGIYRDATDKENQIYTGILADAPFPLNINNSRSYAFYGELTRLLFDGQLEITAGFRYFHDDETGHSKVGLVTLPSGKSVAIANTPRAVVTWHVTPDQMVYFTYGEGFRSGYPQGGLLLATYPNFPALRPDKLYNYELGSKGTLADGRFGYDAAVFYQYWQGIQQALTLPAPGTHGIGVGALFNSGSASGMGADFSVFAKPIDGLTLSAGLGWNDLAFDSDVISSGTVLFAKGARPSGSPSTTVNGSVDYQFPLMNDGYEGTLSAAVNYTSKLAYRGVSVGNITDVGYSDEVYLVRASFTVTAPQHWYAKVFVDNLTNWRGIAARTFVGVDDWNARLRPATAGIQLGYKFSD